MSDFVARSLQHLFKLLKVYLVFALVAVLIALLYGVATGPLSSLAVEGVLRSLGAAIGTLIVIAAVVLVIIKIVKIVQQSRGKI